MVEMVCKRALHNILTFTASFSGSYCDITLYLVLAYLLLLCDILLNEMFEEIQDN